MEMPRFPARSGLSLFEILSGILLLSVLLVSAIQITVTSKAETVAARDQLLAMNVAQALLAEARATGGQASAATETPLADLPMFRGILDEHRKRSPEGAKAIEPQLASFRTKRWPGVDVTVTWTEAGAPRSLVLPEAACRP